MKASDPVEQLLGRAFKCMFINPSWCNPPSVGDCILDLPDGLWECTPVACICCEGQRAAWRDAVENHLREEKLPPKSVRASTANITEIMASFGVSMQDALDVKMRAEKAGHESLKITLMGRVQLSISPQKWQELIGNLEPDINSNYLKDFRSRKANNFFKKGLELVVVRSIVKAAYLKARGIPFCLMNIPNCRANALNIALVLTLF